MADNLPPGFVLEKDAKRKSGPQPPPGFVLEKDVGTQETETPPAPSGIAANLEARRNFAGVSDDLSVVPGLVDALTQGATFGFGDEITAFEKSLTEGVPYDEGLQRERAQQSQFREEHPVLSTTGEIGGAVASALAAPQLIPGRVAQAAGPVMSAIPAWARAVGGGAAAGGLYGYGTGEGGTAARLDEAKTGAAFGAAGGALGYGVGRGVSRLGKELGTLRRAKTSPVAAATRRLASRAELDDLTPDQLLSELDRLGPEATFADVGSSAIRGETRGLATGSVQARRIIEKQLKQRAARESVSVDKAIREGLDPRDYYVARKRFLDDMAKKAGPLYQKAYEAHPSIASPRLAELTKTRFGKRAVRETLDLLEIAKSRGEDIDDATLAALRELKGGKMPEGGLPLKAWNEVKRGFDAVLDSKKMRNETTGRLTTLGREVNASRKAMLNELDEITGGADGLYATARRTYAGEIESLQALQAGRKALRLDAEQVATDLAGMSEAGRQAFRAGLARDVTDRVTKGGVNSVWGTNKGLFKDRLRAAFPDEASYREFAEELSRRVLFRETANEVMAGSRTAPLAADAASALAGAVENTAALTGATLSGSGGGIIKAGIVARASRAVANAIIGDNHPRYYSELASLLTTSNRAQQRAVIDVLRQLPNQQGGSVMARALMVAGGVAEPIATQ